MKIWHWGALALFLFLFLVGGIPLVAWAFDPTFTGYVEPWWFVVAGVTLPAYVYATWKFFRSLFSEMW